MLLRERRITVHLSVAFTGLLVLVACIIATVQYLENSRQNVEAAEERFSAAQIAISARIEEIFRPANLALEVVRQSSIVRAPTLEARLVDRAVLARILEANRAFSSVYVGYPDGGFLLMRPLRTEESRMRFEAPADARYLVQAIVRPVLGVYIFFDEELNEIARQPKPDYTSYNPLVRPWFIRASESVLPQKTEPYVFFTTREVGTTVALAAPGGAVAGVDVTLASLSQAIGALRPIPSADIGLVDGNGVLIAHADASRVVLPNPTDPESLVVSDMKSATNGVLFRAIEAGSGELGNLIEFTGDDGERYLGLVAPVETVATTDYRLVMAVTKSALFAEARAAAFETLLLLGAIIAGGVIFTILLSLHISRPLVKLADDVEAISRFDFAATEATSSNIVEIDRLASAVDEMKGTIRKFLDISSAISAEPNLDRLLGRLLEEMVTTTRTEAGVLYLTSDDGAWLVPHAAWIEGDRTSVTPSKKIALSETDRLLVRAVADENALGGEASEAEIDASGLFAFCRAMKDPPHRLLAAPLYNRSATLIGVLLLLSDEELDQALVSFTERLSGSAAVAVETCQLIEAQRQLFESLLQLIAQAIDAKSPYTAGHCARVPELTKMLARAAESATDGPYAAFSLSEEDWDAVHVASWLHDCGKVTTPEYVVDKATKLETIYDRIHEVRMRIEVMKREAEIAYLRDVVDGNASPERRADYERDLAQLDDDFAFLARCNIGGEFMADEDVERLHSLAEKTWTRTLDDRLGVSDLELQRMAARTERELPVREPLLADKPEHVFERTPADRLTDDNPWGFRVDVPDLLYNRGELHNLSIRRGTLTDEDRYKINEHMIQTIKMLEALPFPAYLKNVPEIAGGHHETMNGTGYPKRLRREDMSPVARMMAIADIFEALTAADRPYKKAKTLSESLRIMTFMVKDDHIDPELFDLFLTSGVYRDYAKAFLSPEQIDEIDIADYRPDLAA